eukprot:457481-Rhodomonas_salina.2
MLQTPTASALSRGPAWHPISRGQELVGKAWGDKGVGIVCSASSVSEMASGYAMIGDSIGGA